MEARIWVLLAKWLIGQHLPCMECFIGAAFTPCHQKGFLSKLSRVPYANFSQLKCTVCSKLEPCIIEVWLLSMWLSV